MPVTPQSLRNAADFMQKASGVDPVWLREAAEEIERLRKLVAEYEYRGPEFEAPGEFDEYGFPISSALSSKEAK